METAQDNTSYDLGPVPIKKMYDPTQYGFLGFFLSLIPVLIMSFANSKVIPNGTAIRKKMKMFLIMFILLIVADIGIMGWAAYTLGNGLSKAIKENPQAMLRVVTTGNPDTFINEYLSEDIKLAKEINNNSGTILFILNIILLVFTVRFTNRNEVPAYKELKAQNQIKIRKPLLPILAGLAFLAAIYFGLPPVLELIIKNLAFKS